ncbi:MAG TPA: hypothetical protein VN873_06035 [Candidatus Angelobacter sp.]|nr:hypothetical protein [Candidatus Angelobacter sp.]
MLLATSAVANPQLVPINPTGFFTNVAMAMFQQMDLHDFNGNLVTITNIPIYQDPNIYYGGTNLNRNYYTPAVHRILQLAANLLDASTNRFIDGGPTNYPTVFRPVFTSQNGQVWISGYQEVTNPTPALNFQYWDLAQAAANQGPLFGINIYGVPWVIGAKKGFPNFNEFSMDNALSIARKLEFTNVVASPPWTTNQLYTLAITNAFGLEAWNSYTNAYGRPLELICSNTMSIVVSNENGFPLIDVNNLNFGNVLNLDGLPGWTESQRTLQIPGADNSFIIPLLVTNAFTNGIYQTIPPQLIPLRPPLFSATFVPHLFMELHIRLQFILIDTFANRVIDFVNIDSTQPAIDIASDLQGNGTLDSVSPTEQWDTNIIHGNVPVGILNQIYVSEFPTIGGSDWTQPSLTIRQQQAQFFRNRLAGNEHDTNYFEAPYTPHATIHQRISWQANDPLVHYMVADMTSTNGQQAEWNSIDVQRGISPPGPSLPNIGLVNFAYQPWGGFHIPGGSDQGGNKLVYDTRVKNAGVQQSDDWDFPAGESLSFEWLGRVHRGTPWQTIDLKPSQISLLDWVRWDNDNVLVTNGNSILVDAPLTHPTNDWQFASLWAQWLNTNDLSTLLSINNTDTNAWEARLDGLTALTNSAFGELDALTLTSNSPQAEIIAQAIQTTRANSSRAFQQIGDVLATPELSVASPFINTNSLSTPSAGGLTDEALEKIPTQLLPLLCLDSIGQIVPANGRLQLSFSGYEGHTYGIEVSSNLTDWVIISTNDPSDANLGIGNFGITNTPASAQQFYRSMLLH